MLNSVVLNRPHATALGRSEGYKASHKPERGNIINQLHKDAVNNSFVERNRKHINAVIDLILFCAKQDIPLRGHHEDEEALNKGNLLELFQLISSYHPEIKKKKCWTNCLEMQNSLTLISNKLQHH